MNIVKNIIFKFKKILYRKFLKRDTMEMEIEQYRKKGVKIGENMRAFSPPYSAEPYLLEFGDNITISTGVKFTTHDNSIDKVIDDATDIFGRIKIGSNCFIGQNSIILPGVELADNIIVAAGSVVTKSFREKGIVIGGNPARVISTIETFKIKNSKFALNTINLSDQDKKAYLLKNEQFFIGR